MVIKSVSAINNNINIPFVKQKNKGVNLNSNKSVDFAPVELKKLSYANLQAYSNISFKSSMTEHLGQGARYLGNNKTRFTITAPHAEMVLATIYSGDIFDEDDVEIKRVFLDKKGDKFDSIVEDVKPGDKYSYSIMKNDGSHIEVYDPRADYLPFDIAGFKDGSDLAEVIDHSQYEWSDQEWMANRSASNDNKLGWGLPSNTVIESMHVGLLGGFKEAKKEIDKIADLGVASAVRVMPLGEFYGDKNWGYDEVAKFAVENSYGRPEDLKDFVNYAHKNGINVILDVVPNHFGPYGSVIQELMPVSVPNESTPWGDKLQFSGEQGKYMRSYMTDMLMNWAVNYHVDGFRMDATQFINSDEALRDMIKDLRSHKETKDLILYPEDMRLSRVMANSNFDQEVTETNWGFSAMTTFDFYKSLIANVTKQAKHNCGPDLDELAYIYKNVNLQTHEDAIMKNKKVDPEYKAKCKKNMSLPMQNADNYLVNISNHDEIGNDEGGKRNLVKVLATNLDIYSRFGDNWQGCHTMLFEMIKHYVETGNCLPKDVQIEMGCNKPITNKEFDKEFHRAFECNKLILAAMFMHPSPKEFFMGDARGDLAPLKFFCDTPEGAINEDTGNNYSVDIGIEKGYAVDRTAFNESMMNQSGYNASWVNEGMQNLSKDFVRLMNSNPAFSTYELDKVQTVVHDAEDVLEVKRYDESGNEVIAVINLSSEPKFDFKLDSTNAEFLNEVINTNDTKYNGDGKYNNKWRATIKNESLELPPNSVVVFETNK